MSLLAKARCTVGRHSGEWSHRGSRCEIARVCDSCGKREEQTHHVWGPFAYLNADQCDQTRRCERCGSTESRSVHEWGSWLYLNGEFNSGQFHTCQRCHQTERTTYTMR
jgi:hypothetical protein